MKLQYVQLPGKLKKAKQLKDKRLSIQFIADEPSEDQLMQVAELEGAQLWCQLSAEDKMPLPDKAPPPLTGSTTESQKMRLALQSLWRNKDSEQTFEEFYSAQMRRITSKIIETANEAAGEWE